MYQIFDALLGLNNSHRGVSSKKPDDVYLLNALTDNYFEKNLHNPHLSFPLDADTSFDNASHNEIQHTLPCLFDRNYNDNFTCINEEVMGKYGKNPITHQIRFKVNRLSDLANKPFFRLCLKKNLDDNETNHLMNLLSDCSFTYEIGGRQIFAINKLLFNFIIGEKLNCGVSKMNAQEFTNTYTSEEIKHRVVNCIDNGIRFNQKYYFEHVNSIYLDIPLLLDFYFYNTHIPIITSQYHEICFIFNIPTTKVKLIEKYVSHIVLMFEENVLLDTKTRRTLVQHSYEMLCMQTSLYNFHCHYSTVLDVEMMFTTTKFIFVIIRRFENMDMCMDDTNTSHDVSQFPTITNIKLEFEINSCTFDEEHKCVEIDLHNMWTSQFTNMMIYGIACDYNKSMSEWIKTTNECVPVLNKMCSSDMEPNDNSHMWSWSYQGIVQNINDLNPSHLYLSKPVSNVKITFDNFQCPMNIEIVTINNNLLRNREGMCGVAYY